MFEVERADDARTAIFTFGSFTNPGRTEPSYAFVNTVLRMRRMRRVVCDAYYFKAKQNDWYFSGLAGTESFEESCHELNRLAEGYDRTVFLGNSMGAYAALAFGLKVKTDLVLAFSPQTRFDLSFSDAIGERRWRTEFDTLRAQGLVEPMSVGSIWPASCDSRIRIFVGGSCPQDVAYVSDLSGKPGLEIMSFAESGHDLVHDLRASGHLEQLIYDGLEEIAHR